MSAVNNSSNFVSVRIDGIAALREACRQLPEKIQNNIMRGALRAAGNVIADEARRRVPARSGQLKASIRTSVRPMKLGIVASVKAGDRFRVFKGKGSVNKKVAYRTARSGGGFNYHAPFYAHFVEFGTKPHLIKPRHGKRLFFAVASKVVSVPMVKHPGAAPRPFLGPAFNAKWRDALQVVEDYLAKRLPIEAEKLNRGKS